MGVVYAAFDHERGEECAIKTLRSLDADSLYRLKSEFRALADVVHPNLVRLGELIWDGDMWFVTMELIAGAPFLRAVQSPAGTLEEGTLRDSLGQLAAGVSALHAAGKIHRDLKPANVLVEATGRVVILDFGLITDPNRSATLASSDDIVGTAAYMAPEQAEVAPVGPAADWYAVGVMIYEALTGRLPFDGPPIQLLTRKIDRDPEPPRDVPRDLGDLAMRLLTRDPAGRAGGEDIAACLAQVSPRRHKAPDSLVSHPPFIGREAEILALERAFSKRAGAVLVVGPSGVGKSALVRELASRLRAEHPVAILRGRCYERESVPYKGLDEAIDELARLLGSSAFADIELPADLDALTRLFPVLRRAKVIARARISVSNAEGHELRRRAVSALRALLCEVAKKKTPALLIDDLQWANADSLALLRDLCAPPAFVVATVRTDGDDDPAIGNLARQLGGCDVISLAGLAPDEATTLAQRLWAEAGNRDMSFDSGKVAKEANGHPLFLDVLIRYMVERGESMHHGARLETAIAARIADLDDDARQLLTAVAVAGAPISQRLATRAAGIDHGSRVVARLRAMRFVRTEGAAPDSAIQPYHDRVREAVQSMLDPEALRAAHVALVDAIEATGEVVEPARLVRHLEAADDPVAAAEVAKRAAVQAVSALAFEQAAALFGDALRLGSHTSDERRTLLTMRAEALANAGRGLDAADIYLEATADAAPGDSLELRRRAADLLLRHGLLDRGLNIVSDLMAAMNIEYPATSTRTLRRVIVDRFRLKVMRLSARHVDDTHIDPDDLKRLDLYTTLGLSLGFIDPLRSAYFRFRGLRLARKLGATSRLSMCMAGEAASSAYMGDFAVAERLLDAIDRTRPHDALTRAHYTGVSGSLLSVRGKLARAEAQIRECLEDFQRNTVGTEWQIAVGRLFHLFALRDAGRCRELCEAYDTYVRDALDRGDRFAAATMMRGFNQVWLYRDKPDVAERELAELQWAPRAVGYHIQHWYELIARSDIALYVGPTRTFLETFERGYGEAGRSLLYRAQAERYSMLWTRGRLALAFAEDGPVMIRRARSCARALERLVLPLGKVAGTLMHAGVACHRKKLDEACARFESVARGDHEYGLMAASARWRWGQLVGGERGAALVAEAERWMRREAIVNPRRVVAMLAPLPRDDR